MARAQDVGCRYEEMEDEGAGDAQRQKSDSQFNYFRPWVGAVVYNQLGEGRVANKLDMDELYDVCWRYCVTRAPIP